MNINCLRYINVVHFRKKSSAKNKYYFKIEDECLNTVDIYKYFGPNFYEYLTFDLGVTNNICLKGGRPLGACLSRFKALKDVGFITFTKLCITAWLTMYMWLLLCTLGAHLISRIRKITKSCHQVFSWAWATDSHLGNAGGDGMVESYYKTLIRPIDYTAMEQDRPARSRKIAIYCRPI